MRLLNYARARDYLRVIYADELRAIAVMPLVVRH